MHCPNCGQQQISLDIKFCSRCGFPMALIPDLLANGGTLPNFNAPGGKKKFWTRKNGIFLSIMWVLFCWFLMAPICGVIDFEEGAAFFGIVGFFGGVFGVVTSLFFLESSKIQYQYSMQNQMQPGALPNAYQQYGALPPQQSIPADQYIQPGHWKAPDTGQFAQPGSVVDGTTKLFEKDK